MYLLDTNIILEILLDQDHAEEAVMLLENAPDGSLFISDFSLHSIGVVLFSRKLQNTYLEIVRDLFKNLGVTLTTVEPIYYDEIIRASSLYNLDFDDAYQYAAAEINHLTIISFDGDFNRTAHGRKTPKEVL